MTDNLIISLLHKQLTDQLDSTDKQVLADWLAHSSQNEEVQREVSQVWELSKSYQPSFVPDVNKSFEKFSQRISAESPSTNIDVTPSAKVMPLSPVRSWMKYAAVGVVLLGTVLVWQLTQNATVNSMLASTINNETKEITLADGTIVALNEKSTLTYPDKFNGDQRVVELSGEAYFDVASDSKKPFIIKGGDADVKVIGTAFLFDTDNDNGVMSVEVEEGIVELIPAGSSEKMTITENEIGYFDSKNKKFLDKEILKVSNANYFIKGTYSFVDSKYDYVFNILSKEYDVDFKFENDELVNCELTSPIQFKNGIQNTLSLLEKVYDHRNLKFEKLDDTSYLISADSCD